MNKKLFFILPALMVSLTMMAELKPLRVLVLGDDPMMVSDDGFRRSYRFGRLRHCPAVGI